jgi:hypothetical protein
LLVERQQQRALPPLTNSKAKKAGGGKSERQLIENRYSHYVPKTARQFSPDRPFS